jgi:ketosteroid isomerase-like protein
MPLLLPKPIAGYFAADPADRDAVADFFTLDAVVIDEKQTHRGRNAIARWKAETSAKYDYTSEPVAIDDQGERIIVTAHVAGNFPGSPVDLRYAFTLAGDAIARLEIVS